MTFLLTQRSIDLSLSLTCMTLAAFLVQITSAPIFFKVPKYFTPFILQNDIFNKNEKPETRHGKPMLVWNQQCIKHSVPTISPVREFQYASYHYNRAALIFVLAGLNKIIKIPDDYWLTSSKSKISMTIKLIKV